MAIDTQELIKEDELLDKLVTARDQILSQVRKVIIAQDEVIDQAMLSLFVGGHALVSGVPGLAKTLLIRTIANVLDLTFKRIQFTPDLMPSDITGTDIIEEDRTTGHRRLEFIRGPLFANIILADEINRTPPKTQAALLEAMQERQVTVGRVRHRLDAPFFVLATQNPIEQEGTYPLPEAQQDRFMFKVFVKYPKFDEEFEIARRTTALASDEVSPVLNGEQILELQNLVRRVPVGEPGIPRFVRDWLSWGAGPRAVQYLILGGKARALLHGRVHVQTEDIKALAYPVLRHRILTNFTAASEGISSDTVVKKLIEETPDKESELTRDERFRKIFAS